MDFVVHLIVRYAPWFWLGVCILLAAIEALTYSLTTIWFAFGALVVVFVSMFDVPTNVQVIVFAVVSLILFIWTRPIASKIISQRKQPLSSNSIIGRVAPVLEVISDVEKGTLRVNGIEWKARSIDESVIQVGELCEIMGIEGATALVQRYVPPADL